MTYGALFRDVPDTPGMAGVSDLWFRDFGELRVHHTQSVLPGNNPAIGHHVREDPGEGCKFGRSLQDVTISRGCAAGGTTGCSSKLPVD